MICLHIHIKPLILPLFDIHNIIIATYIHIIIFYDNYNNSIFNEVMNSNICVILLSYTYVTFNSTKTLKSYTISFFSKNFCFIIIFLCTLLVRG